MFKSNYSYCIGSIAQPTMMDTRYLILITLLAFCLAQSRAFFRPFGKPSLKQTRLLADVSTLDETNAGIKERVIKITEKAMTHLSDLKAKQGLKKCLRMGVRAGGCSGMSYVMDFIDEADITDDDHIEEYEGIKCVVDPKSLLYIYGLNLDYSDELIGGGFKFTNPNAETSCGCGKSFGV